MADECTNKDISITQRRDGSPGIPRFSVQIVNTCMSDCAPADIHVYCGWFASSPPPNPNVFQRVSYDDCLVNGGRPLGHSTIIQFQYANSFMYPLQVRSARFCRWDTTLVVQKDNMIWEHTKLPGMSIWPSLLLGSSSVWSLLIAFCDKFWLDLAWILYIAYSMLEQRQPGMATETLRLIIWYWWYDWEEQWWTFEKPSLRGTWVLLIE